MVGRSERSTKVFFHTKRFQYNAKPDAPDPIFAKQMQELIGGQWSETLLRAWIDMQAYSSSSTLVGTRRQPSG
jgi:Mn-containing catalase